MTEAVKTATAWGDEANLKQEQEAIMFLKEQGLTVIEPDLNAFMEYSENYYLNDKDMVKDWDMELYHQIKDLKY